MQFFYESWVAGFKWDAVMMDKDIVATVEFKRAKGVVNSDWWISGLTPGNKLVVIGRFSFGLGPSAEFETGQSISRIYETFLQPLVALLLPLGGMPESPNAASYETKRLLSLAHLELHAAEGRIGKDFFGIKTDIARQFQLIKSFGLSGAQSLISERTGLPLSTVTRRLYMAREAGLIEKMSKTPVKKRGNNA
jgi:hypothetical protein